MDAQDAPKPGQLSKEQLRQAALTYISSAELADLGELTSSINARHVEIGRAEATQGEAARLKPDANPVGIEHTTLGQAAMVRTNSKLLQLDSDSLTPAQRRAQRFPKRGSSLGSPEPPAGLETASGVSTPGMSPAQLRAQRFPKNGPSLNTTGEEDNELTPAQKRALRFPKAGDDFLSPGSPSQLELHRAASEEAIKIIGEMEQHPDNQENATSTKPPEQTMYQLQRRLSEVMQIQQRTQPPGYENQLGLTEEEQIDWSNGEANISKQAIYSLARRFSALGRAKGRQPAAA